MDRPLRTHRHVSSTVKLQILSDDHIVLRRGCRSPGQYPYYPPYHLMTFYTHSKLMFSFCLNDLTRECHHSVHGSLLLQDVYRSSSSFTYNLSNRREAWCFVEWDIHITMSLYDRKIPNLYCIIVPLYIFSFMSIIPIIWK